VRVTTILTLVFGIALLTASVGLGARDRSESRHARDQALTSAAREESVQLAEYFARARTIVLISAQNPSFRDFYTSPGARRQKIRERTAATLGAENALAYLERLYPTSIGEACFIDRGGAENARFVKGRRAPIADLSPDESANPFFAPTFALPAGQVFQARPYVSPDTHEWVISNSTPVPGTGYPAAAIVHFEVTVESFRRAAAQVAGRNDLAIVDARSGRVVIDSRVPQRVGAPLATDDRRYARLAAQERTAGTETVNGHRAAFAHLSQSRNNVNDWYVVAIDSRRTSMLRDIGWAPVGMAVSALALLVLTLFSFRSGRRARVQEERARREEATRAEAERSYFETQHEFTEVMQITRDESEAYHLLKLHLERSLPGSDVLVLNRNNSHDRLEPMTELPADSTIAERLKGAEPDACLAVRLGKPHERGPDREPLLSCELCGKLPSSPCVPSLVGGEVIGAVLVQHPTPLDTTNRRRVEASITQASPVLANLRNLAVSQARALTDQLTGLPNRRSIDDTLKRMAAYAERSVTPLAAVLFDLDHFKSINDLAGHEKGDEVLAAVGVAVAGTVRASDFVGRHGGEEFILLLPDTDRAGAVVIAEKVRAAIGSVEVAGVSQPISASLGVAAIPEDAHEPMLLMRAADRALYLAKAQGRNQVATLVAHDAEPLTFT
jgi:diguanylate cyclase (GGDEF)-like protein